MTLRLVSPIDIPALTVAWITLRGIRRGEEFTVDDVREARRLSETVESENVPNDLYISVVARDTVLRDIVTRIYYPAFRVNAENAPIMARLELMNATTVNTLVTGQETTMREMNEAINNIVNNSIVNGQPEDARKVEVALEINEKLVEMEGRLAQQIEVAKAELTAMIDVAKRHFDDQVEEVMRKTAVSSRYTEDTATH